MTRVLGGTGLEPRHEHALVHVTVRVGVPERVGDGTRVNHDVAAGGAAPVFPQVTSCLSRGTYADIVLPRKGYSRAMFPGTQCASYSKKDQGAQYERTNACLFNSA